MNTEKKILRWKSQINDCVMRIQQINRLHEQSSAGIIIGGWKQMYALNKKIERLEGRIEAELSPTCGRGE